jgi:cytochrome P450
MSEREPIEKEFAGKKLDIHESKFALDPYPTYERLRAECPVKHSELYGGFWLLTRYADVRHAAIDWRTFTSSVVGVTAIPIITRRTEPMLPIELDPPLHSRYRALVNPVLSPERIEELRPRVAAIATRLVDRLLAKGSGDLVPEFAVPLSVETLAEFAGLPKQDSGLWVAWIRRMFNVSNSADSERASHEFAAYIDGMIRRRRAEPCGDFVSILMESEVEGHRLTDKEIHSFCTVLFGAGFETTADALSVMLYYLAEHPEDRRRLTAEPALIPSAVEEFLRFVSPIQIFGRNATRDVEMHGQSIPNGDVVALSFGSANHDPTVFAEPEHCVLDRTPNRHLAFGAGIHLCLGAPVARLEMALTLAEFSRRVGELKIAEGGSVKWKTRGDRRGLDTLPVVLAGK